MVRDASKTGNIFRFGVYRILGLGNKNYVFAHRSYDSDNDTLS